MRKRLVRDAGTLESRGAFKREKAYTCPVALAFSAPDTVESHRSDAPNAVVALRTVRYGNMLRCYSGFDIVRFPDRKSKGIRWMPWLEEAMKDVVRLR